MVKSSLRFLHPSPHPSEKPYTLRFTPTTPFPRTNITTTHHHDLEIHDIRGRETEFSLERNGFALVELKSKLRYEEFGDEGRVVGGYLREVADLVRGLVGGRKVLVLEHLVRKRHADFPISTGEKYEYNQPTTLAHVDTTLDWAAQKLTEMNGGKSPASRYQFINIWKPLRGPVNDWPLALCDNTTVDPTTDLQASDLVFADYVVENCQVYYRDRQRWYYVSGQREDECWLFVQADSEGGRAGESSW